MRTADIRRDTRETRIQLSLNLDGTGKADIATGVGFLDHMLELFARHGDFDLTVRCQGTLRWTATTAWRTSASAWAGPLQRPWGTSGVSRATASSSCPWTRRWCWWPATFPAGTIWLVRGPARPKGGGLRYGAGQGVLPGLRPGVPHVPPHPADGRGEHPPHSGGRVQGRGPGLEDGCGPGRKTPG